MAYILILAFILGLVMYLPPWKNGKTVEIGRLLIGTTLLALFIAIAPLTVRLLAH